MGQAEIYEMMKEKPNKWFTMIQLMKKININRASLNMNLLRMEKGKIIEVKRTKNHISNPYKYKLKKKEKRDQ